jgi:hypothetical protein
MDGSVPSQGHGNILVNAFSNWLTQYRNNASKRFNFFTAMTYYLVAADVIKSECKGW